MWRNILIENQLAWTSNTSMGRERLAITQILCSVEYIMLVIRPAIMIRATRIMATPLITSKDRLGDERVSR